MSIEILSTIVELLAYVAVVRESAFAVLSLTLV